MNLKDNWIAGIYIRLSKSDKEKNESESVINQRNFIIAYLTENNYKLYDEYIDDGISGTNFNRPSFNRMLQDIQNKKINMVITKDASRLGRNNEEFIKYTERYFPEHNIRYISILDGIDTYLDNIGNEMIQLKGMINEWYSKDISKKIKASLEIKKKQGLYLSGNTPYGYKHDPINKYKLIIDNNISNNVKLIFEMFIKGNSINKIAKYLTDKNIPTPSVYKNMKFNNNRITRNIWDPRTISNILKNQIYIGNLIQNKRKKVNYKSKKIILNSQDKWIIVENTHEPIIDKETFEIVQNIYSKNKNKNKKTQNYLLKGFIFCKECGHTLGINKSKNNSRNYTICNHYKKYRNNSLCSPHSCRYEIIEKLVLNEIKELSNKSINNKKLQDMLNNITNTKSLDEVNKKIRNINNKIQNNENALKVIYKDRAKGIIDLNTYKNVYNEIIIEINEYKKMINDLERQKKEYIKKINNENNNKIIEEYLSMKKPSKIILSHIIEKITIDNNKNIDIYYKVKPIL